MKTRPALAFFAVVITLAAAPSGRAVSKELIQIQQQLETLQQTVENMQKTVDTQGAILKTLVEQANDNVNSMKAAVADLQKTNAQNLATSNSRFDSLTGQIQALSESLEESKARLGKLSEQLAQTQNIIQTLNTQPSSGSAPGSPSGPGSGGQPGPNPNRPAVSVPDPDTLYKSGLNDYSTGHYDLAIQEFQQYVQNYGDTDLASNAQFYVGDSYYSQKKYDQAIEEYNKCLERYPNGNKLPAAQLKKAYALIALGQTQAGARELRSLIKRFPNSHEADLARQRLKRLS
ncbi:MAG TPA: tol-pal system protein YbgF [Terriglobia bacterium]